MKFVHVEDFIHPDAGYQLNLLSKLQVEQGHEVTIITAEIEEVPIFLTSFFGKEDIDQKDEAFFKRTGVRILRHPIYRFLSGRAIFKSGLHRLIKDQKPDVLFVHGEDTLTGMKLLWDYKKMNVPYVLDCHMLEMASENRFREYFRVFFRKFVTPIILKNHIPLIRVVDSDFVEKHFNIPLNKTHLLSFGTDTNYYRPDAAIKLKYREEYKFDEEDFIVLYAGKLDSYKGGEFLSSALKQRIEAKGRNIKFIIIGTSPKDDYGREVEYNFSQSENDILRMPTQTYAGLAKYYQMADIAIFPKQCSMSYYEVQSCGLPVILEENEINVERASNFKGIIFKEQSQESLRDAIIEFAEMDKFDFDSFKKNARENVVQNYDYVHIAQKFTNVMIDEHKRFYNSQI
ncbi:MAG TPA: glycosyltransferase family 4 protein [Sphingobacteriaceae bacterium]|nr:glycosyltransferase family 4 protein [Sphingobacteriaceae bacterium]